MVLVLLLYSLCDQVRGEACHCCNIHWVGGCSSLERCPIVVVVVVAAASLPWLAIGIVGPGVKAVCFDTC